MADVLTSEVDAKFAPVNVGLLNFIDRFSKDEQFFVRPFLSKTKNTNMAAV
jgi:hypothetical protein